MNQTMMEELSFVGSQVATAWTNTMGFADRYNLSSEMAGILTQFNRLYASIQEFSANGIPDYDVNRDEPLFMDWDGEQ